MKMKNQDRWTEHGLKLMALIKQLFVTKEGFCREDAKKIGISDCTISSRCWDMIQIGQLFVAKAKGRRAHYFSTETAAREWESSAAPEMTERRKFVAGRDKEILEKAATPSGYCPFDTDRFAYRHNREACRVLVDAGKIYKACIGHKSFFFTSAEVRDAVIAANRQVVEQRARDVEKAKWAGKQAQIKLTRPPKPPKEPKIPKVKKIVVTKKALLLEIKRKPYVPPAPRKPVEIIYPDNYRRIVIPTPAPRFTAIDRPSFLHGGMGQMK